MIAQSPLKKIKEKAHNSFSQWPLSTVFRSLHLLDKQLNRRSSSSLNVRLVVICDCTATNKKSAVSTELVSSPDTEQKFRVFLHRSQAGVSFCDEVCEEVASSQTSINAIWMRCNNTTPSTAN
jgi:hypothetical protein